MRMPSRSSISPALVRVSMFSAAFAMLVCGWPGAPCTPRLNWPSIADTFTTVLAPGGRRGHRLSQPAHQDERRGLVAPAAPRAAPWHRPRARAGSSCSPMRCRAAAHPRRWRCLRRSGPGRAAGDEREFGYRVRHGCSVRLPARAGRMGVTDVVERGSRRRARAAGSARPRRAPRRSRAGGGPSAPRC